MSDPSTLFRLMVRVAEKIHKRGDEALALAREAQSPLRARSYAAGRAPKGELSDETGDVACAREARKGGTSYQQLCQAVDSADAALVRLERLLDAQFATGSKDKQRRAGQGACIACGDYVPGVGEDRLKAGLCPKHYMGLHRARREHGVTRQQYIDEVRRAG